MDRWCYTFAHGYFKGIPLHPISTHCLMDLESIVIKESSRTIYLSTIFKERNKFHPVFIRILVGT